MLVSLRFFAVKHRRIGFRKLARVLVPLAVTALMIILSTFGGIGYRVDGIQELSFTPKTRYGYADAVFAINMTFNPLLHPFQWLIGKGSVSSNFSMIYLPHAYDPGDFIIPLFGSSEEHYENYISYVVSSATLANTLILLVLTIAIELLQRRAAYVALFAGMLGFPIMGLNGVLIGLVVGAIALAYITKSKRFVLTEGLRGYILKRIIYSFALIILVITINFVIFMKMPANPMDFLYLSRTPTAAEADVARRFWGLNEPLVPQYLTYLRNLLSFNLGNAGKTLRETSDSPVIPVAQSLSTRLPFTVLVLGVSTTISVFLGVIIGCLTLYWRGKLVDTMSVLSSSVLMSLPVQWIGAIFLLFFGYRLGWFPHEGASPMAEWIRTQNVPNVFATGVSYSHVATIWSVNFNMLELWRLVWGYLQYAVLPVLTLVISQVGIWVLLTRASLLETVGEPYLITAKAKGLTDWKVLTKHALRNAYLPIVTSAALSYGFVVAGSMFVEIVFRYPGIGLWLYDSVQNRDFVVLMTVFYVISIFVIMANVIADVLYGILDPRIKSS